MWGYADSSRLLPVDRPEEGRVLPEEAELAGGEVPQRNQYLEDRSQEREFIPHNKERDGQIYGLQVDLCPIDSRTFIEIP